MQSNKALISLLSGLMLLSAGCSNSQTAAILFDDDTDGTAHTSQSIERTLTVIGASTPYPALELLAETYKQEVDNTEIIFLDSSQSDGGIEAVKEGLAAIGTVTRSPKLEEADEQLTHRAFARDGILVGTHPSVTGVSNLTTQNLQDIYSGKVTNWNELGGPDADVVVLDRAEDTSAKRLLREYYLGDDLANAPNAILLNRERDVIDTLQTMPYSIGTLSLAKATAQSLPINHMSLDGIEPSPQDIASGKYGMHRTLGIVWYGTPSKASQGFVDFVFSESGSRILEKAGFVPTS